jgi:hypothetical protein
VIAFVVQLSDEFGKNIQPDVIMSDYELAILAAMASKFPTARVKGCWFHYCQVHNLSENISRSDETSCFFCLSGYLSICMSTRIKKGMNDQEDLRRVVHLLNGFPVPLLTSKVVADEKKSIDKLAQQLFISKLK